MGALDALLIPLFIVFSIVPYATYWVLRRMCAEEERKHLRLWGDPLYRRVLLQHTRHGALWQCTLSLQEGEKPK